MIERKIGVGFNHPMVLGGKRRFDWRKRLELMRRMVRLTRRRHPWPLPQSVVEASRRHMRG
jgi:hypothetical protein